MMKRVMRFLCLFLSLLLMMHASAEVVPAEIPVPQPQSAVTVAEDEDPLMALLPQIDGQVQAYLTAQGLTWNGAYAGFRPMTAEADQDGTAIIAIGDLYTAPMQMDLLDFDAFSDIEWLDQRAVVMIRWEADGWILVSVSFGDELVMEDASAAYYAETMLTATDGDAGWTVQYPAVFGALIPANDDDGCVGYTDLSGGDNGMDIAFFAGSQSNTTHMKTSDMVRLLQARHPQAQVTVNETSGVICVRDMTEDTCVAEYAIVTETTIYHVVMTWDAGLNADFVLYSDYVMNSFCVDELGIG